MAKAVNDFLQQDLLGLAGAAAQLEAKMEPDPNLKIATLLDRALANVDKRFADAAAGAGGSAGHVGESLSQHRAEAYLKTGRSDEAVKVVIQGRRAQAGARGRARSEREARRTRRVERC